MEKTCQCIIKYVGLNVKIFGIQVMEVVNGDALIVKTSEGTMKKMFLASLRPPR